MSQCWLILSGKGGVGKSALTAALGYALSEMDNSTCCLDGDMGLRDLDLIMNQHSRVVYNLADVARRECRLKTALLTPKGQENLALLPASQNAGHDLVTPEEYRRVVQLLKRKYAYILADAPAGMEAGVRSLVPASDYSILVVTPDDVCIRNAERMLSLMDEMGKQRPFLIVNRVREDMVRKGWMYTPQTVSNLLDAPLLGYVPEDEEVLYSLNNHRSFMQMNCPAARAVKRIARRMAGTQVDMPALKQRRLRLD